MFFALHAIDTRPAARAAVLDAHRHRIRRDYTDDFGYPSYAGATGKLTAAVELGGRDPRAFGGVGPRRAA